MDHTITVLKWNLGKKDIDKVREFSNANSLALSVLISLASPGIQGEGLEDV
jgi:hypothetical protein